MIGLAGGAAVIALTIVLVTAATRDPLSSRNEAQHQVAAQVAAAENTTVTATCTEPDSHGYACRLRDRAGRYGYAATGYYQVSQGDGEFASSHHEGLMTWGFPVAADGTVTTSFDVRPPSDVSASVSRSLLLTGDALGRTDLLTTIDCAPPHLGMDYQCTAHAPVLSVRLAHGSGTHYDLTYRVAVP